MATDSEEGGVMNFGIAARSLEITDQHHVADLGKPLVVCCQFNCHVLLGVGPLGVCPDDVREPTRA